MTCAYHLCGKVFVDPDPRAKYCSLRCYQQAKLWRWRNRKPKARAEQQHGEWLRRQRRSIKAANARRRRPLATASERVKKRLDDGRETPTESVA